MRTKIQLILILLTVPAAFSEDHKYCEIKSCQLGTHTLCRFSMFKFADNCGIPKSAGIDFKLRRSIVDFHNNYRLPNNYLLEWDKELAYIAQRWADQCERKIDECRNVDRFNVIQRIDAVETLLNETEPSIFNSIVKWHQLDHLRFTPQIVNFDPDHHCEMSWGKANRIGCGLVRTQNWKVQQMYFVCNYGHMHLVPV